MLLIHLSNGLGSNQSKNSKRQQNFTELIHKHRHEMKCWKQISESWAISNCLKFDKIALLLIISCKKFSPIEMFVFCSPKLSTKKKHAHVNLFFTNKHTRETGVKKQRHCCHSCDLATKQNSCPDRQTTGEHKSSSC